jgi:hypothetical protein
MKSTLNVPDWLHDQVQEACPGAAMTTIINDALVLALPTWRKAEHLPASIRALKAQIRVQEAANVQAQKAVREAARTTPAPRRRPARSKPVPETVPARRQAVARASATKAQARLTPPKSPGKTPAQSRQSKAPTADSSE